MRIHALEKARKQLGSVANIAKAAGVDSTTIHRWDRTGTMPLDRSKRIMAAAKSVKPGDFFR